MPAEFIPTPGAVLLTGATGFIGGRLVPRLLECGRRVRCLVRDPVRLQGRAWLGQVEVATGDCLRAETPPPAMHGMEVAFYLVHSMAGGRDFEHRDLQAARNFAVRHVLDYLVAALTTPESTGRVIEIGGVGLRRGRRGPRAWRVGDALDFRRVEAVEPDRLLRLRAEMRLPGRAWLEFRVESVDPDSSRLFQTAFFAPRGLTGFLYWYLLHPIHAVILGGLVKRLARLASRQ